MRRLELFLPCFRTSLPCPGFVATCSPALLLFLALLFPALLFPGLLCAQAVPAVASESGATSASATTNDAGPAGIVAYVKGYNLSLGTSSQHDSSDGWSSLLTPDLAWRFNRHFSADATLPLYVYINVLENKGTKARPVYVNATRRFVLGDTSDEIIGNADIERSIAPACENVDEVRSVHRS